MSESCFWPKYSNQEINSNTTFRTNFRFHFLSISLPTRRTAWSRLRWPSSILAAMPKVICPIHSYHLVVNWSITPAPYSLNGSVINYHHLRCGQKEKVEKRREKSYCGFFSLCLLSVRPWIYKLFFWSMSYRWVQVNMNPDPALPRQTQKPYLEAFRLICIWEAGR